MLNSKQLALLQKLKEFPLIASVQAREGSPLAAPEHLLPMAMASLAEGVRVLRLEGVAAINLIKRHSNAPIIGLIKRSYVDSEVYITPTSLEVDELLETGCEMIAIDVTDRRRPAGAQLKELVEKVHGAGRLVLADCDTASSAAKAVDLGCDAVSTTLGGYTLDRPKTDGPDLDLLRQIAFNKPPIFLAEGRFEERWQIEAALRIGADGVVVGGALNDPYKNTARLAPAPRVRGNVGAVDIGGTWLRFGLFSDEWQLMQSWKTALPADPLERIRWIKELIRESKPRRVGVSTGGVVNRCCEVIHAKPTIPGHVGTNFFELAEEIDVDERDPVIALNDGLATAWAHACHPEFAGLNVASLTIGTGVGCGYVHRGRLVLGPNGEPPHLNDLPAIGGRSYEELLGGAALSPSPSDDQKLLAREAASNAVRTLATLLMPDVIVLAGTVGLQPWLQIETPVDPQWQKAEIALSPFGSEAGLYGAAALALYPPRV